MDDIWNFIEEKLNTPVPHYFKTVLSVCGYSNGISISLIGDEDLNYIEKEVKNGTVGKALNGVEDYLKGCTKNAADFEFVLGHRKFLLAIAGFLSKYIAENGADSIASTEKHSDIKKKNKRGPQTQPSKGTKEKNPILPSRKRVGKNDPRVKPLVEYAMSTQLHLQQRSSTVPPEVLQEHRQVLLERMIGCLIRLTPKLFKEHLESIKNKISGDFLVFELDDDCEDKVAVAKCVYCTKTLTCYLRPTQNNPKIWKTSNFDRHMKIIHRFEDTPPDDSDVESSGKRSVEEAGVSYSDEVLEVNGKAKLTEKQIHFYNKQITEVDDQNKETVIDSPENENGKKAGQMKREGKLDDVGNREVVSVQNEELEEASDEKKSEVAERTIQLGTMQGTVDSKQKRKKAGHVERSGKLGKSVNGENVEVTGQNEDLEKASETKIEKKAEVAERNRKLGKSVNGEDVEVTGENEELEKASKEKIEKKAEVAERNGNKVGQVERNEKLGKFSNGEVVEVAGQHQKLEMACNKKIKKKSGHEKVDVASQNKQKDMEVEGTMRELSIMRNGFKSRHGNKSIVTTNTCAFDTILHTFASIYSKYSFTRNQFDGTHSKIAELLKSIASTPSAPTAPASVGHSQEVYATRNVILKDLYEGWCSSSSIQSSYDTTFIDCKTGLGGLFGKICKNEETFASSVLQRTCTKCGANFKKVNPFLNTTEKIRNLGKISEYLDILPRERVCQKCQSKCETEMILNNVVLLEREPKTALRNEAVTLRSITPELLIGSTTYNLHGVMHFEQKKEHFVAYVHDHNTTWKCFDDVKKNVYKCNADITVNPFILCYVSSVRQLDFEKSIVAKAVLSTVQCKVPCVKNEPHATSQDEPDQTEFAVDLALAAPKNEEQESKKRKKNRDPCSSKKRKNLHEN